MPFDCMPVLDVPNQVKQLAGDSKTIAHEVRTDKLIQARPLPHWYLPEERIEAAVAVLVRARELISEEQRWCKRSFARAWFDIPVPVHSGFARRFCALGAIRRAGRELRLSTQDASNALKWQTIRPVPDWNDDACRTHDDVVAAFDAAVVALE